MKTESRVLLYVCFFKNYFYFLLLFVTLMRQEMDLLPGALTLPKEGKAVHKNVISWQ